MKVTLENVLLVQEKLNEINRKLQECFQVVNHAINLLTMENMKMITLTREQKDALLTKYQTLKEELQILVNELPQEV